jgi:phosphoribosylformylglycinamidine (FGAM) synthase PurS component
MAHNDFSISITDKVVDVRYTPSVSDPRGKLFGFIFIISTLVVLACALLFLPGKHGNPSMWHDLASAPTGSSGFLIPVIGLMLFIGLFGWQGFRYARAAWASDETFHCDREAITISRIPWLNFSNRIWRTYTYPLTEVSAIRFAVIASAKGRQSWGLRFRAHGRKWVLPGLEAPEAKTILTGLKALGADVPDDPKLDKRIKETLEMRFGDTSWMDRSWMNPDKQ